MAISPESLAISRGNHETTNLHADKNTAMSNVEPNGCNNGQTAQSCSIAAPKTSIDNSASSAVSSNEVTLVDFTGDVNTNNELPTQAMLKSVEDMPLLDKDGKTVPFKNLYSGANVTRRMLVIFIRHFFCGNCQEFLRTLSSSVTISSLLRLPIPTFITVIGHGSPSLIPMYTRETRCPFPIYADPTKHLYATLGMVRTLNMGARPEYQRRGTVKGMWQSVVQGLSNLKGGRALQGLDWHQVGGEFLFEPVDMSTPITSPASEVNRQLNGDGATEYVEDKQITWCHRMKNTRDHAELPELREILGLDGAGEPGKHRNRWTKAMGERKGTGLSTRTSISLTRNEGRIGQQRMSVSVERENALRTLNGESSEGLAEEREEATAAVVGEDKESESATVDKETS